MMVKRYFNKMLSEGIEPTRHTYNIMFWGFFLSLRLDTANRFYEDMKTRGIAPDTVTYNTLINGYTRFNRMEEAEKLFVEMKAKNLAPTVISYTTMIKGYVVVEKVDDGLRLFEEIKSFGTQPNAPTYSTLLPGLCDVGKTNEAKTILKDMVERYIAPKDNSIFIKLLNSQCKSGDMKAASDVLKAMIRLSIPSEFWVSWINFRSCYAWHQHYTDVSCNSGIWKDEATVKSLSIYGDYRTCYTALHIVYSTLQHALITELNLRILQGLAPWSTLKETFVGAQLIVFGAVLKRKRQQWRYLASNFTGCIAYLERRECEYDQKTLVDFFKVTRMTWLELANEVRNVLVIMGKGVTTEEEVGSPLKPLKSHNPDSDPINSIASAS
ncbi:hypothetical protein F3Y22_tig00112637pilonHSYRG00069 [Hibiscus syriacus]|uniref:Pentatricopeptide repeat-containing protein n=1 Tax=Hibiscus syriacus TaxID=106335 RepID=A0A6A2WVB6_HIBSY|nr:hypothetical protein F3Y22_tig00112637pilonHSYRG00069 [Hibiscus syriacus]